MEICKIIHGSHLYGTNTPSSDHDYKSIVLPSWEDVCLGKIGKGKTESTGNDKSKNTSEDIDCETFSLHQFIKLALEGQTVALDMLHAPASNTLVRSKIWGSIIANRSKFYTRNIESFVGYAQGQASKYGIKGSRLNDAKAVLDWLGNEMIKAESDNFGGTNTRVRDCDLSTFPKGEHISWSKDHQNIDMVEVCNRKFNVSTKLHYAKEIVNHFYTAYGHRARQAANNENIDWKAISHAFRAAFQIKRLFTEKTIIFPLPEAEFVKDIKMGMYKYNTIATRLEDLIDEVKVLREKSDLPETPDVKFWDEWLISVVEEYIVPHNRRNYDVQ